MSIYDESKDTEGKVNLQREKDAKVSFPEAHNIKENVVGLARNIKETSVNKAHVAADYVLDRVDDLKDSGTDTLGKIEEHIQSKPAQSLAIAFVAGLLANFLFGRRSS